MINNLVVDNGAGTAKVGVKLKAATGRVFFNNTVMNNATTGSGDETGGVRCDHETTLYNSVVWGNTPVAAGQQISAKCTPVDCALDTTPDLKLEGGATPTSPEGYRPLPDSPCVDKGTPAGAPPLDFFGFPRFDKPDIGAIEY